MEKLTVNMRAVTPIFLGGAQPEKGAELRPPSVKALLRFWYRAIDPDYAVHHHEAKLFGSADRKEGQGLFLLRILESARSYSEPWTPGHQSNQTHPRYGQRPDHSSEDLHTWTLDGLRYFSQFLGHSKSKRASIPPCEEVTLSLVFKKTPEAADRRRILAATWLLGHFGGVGSRSRRGFGSLALQSWGASTPQDWPELNELAVANGKDTPEGWVCAVESARNCFKAWFGSAPSNDHTVLDGNARMLLFDRGCLSWEEALGEAGLAMQTFRQRYDLSDPGSDYYRVKRHLCRQVLPNRPSHPGCTMGAAPLPRMPDRAAFGLPLMFRFSSLNNATTTFRGEVHDRSASRIHVRVIRIGRHYHPLYLRLSGPLLEDGEQMTETKNGRTSLSPPADTILGEFWRTLPPGREVSW